MPTPKLSKTVYPYLYYYRKNSKNIHYTTFKYQKVIYKRKICEGKTHREAHKLALEMRQRIIDKKEAISKETVENLFYLHMLHSKNRVSNNHYKTQAVAFNKHIQPMFGKRVIKSIAYNELATHVLGKLDKYAVSTVYQIKRVLIDIYRRTPQLENIAEKIELPHIDNDHYFNMHIDDAKKLYKAIQEYPDAKYRSFFLFGLQGRRRAEIAGLKWSDIDFKNMLYYVRPETAKNNQHQLFGLSEHMANTLQELEVESMYVHVNNAGNPLYHIRKRWVKLLEDNGIPYMRFHDLRHLLGALAINAGYSLEHIAQALGHKSINATKRYSKLRETAGIELVRDIHDRLD